MHPSLIVQEISDKDSCGFGGQGTRPSTNPTINLQHADFLVQQEALKELLLMPYNHKEATFALHRLDNVLMIEKVPLDFDVMDSSISMRTNRINSSDKERSHPVGRSCTEIDGFNVISPFSFDSMSASAPISTSKQSVNDPTNLPSASVAVVENNFIRGCTETSRSTRAWRVRDMSIAVDTDMVVYRTDDHSSGFVLKSLDINSDSEIEFSTCLDLYLDGIISNVPELAIALRSKGYTRSISFIDCQDIPYMNSAFFEDSEGIEHQSNVQIPANHQFSPAFMNSLVLASKCAPEHRRGLLSESKSFRRNGEVALKIFDPKVIEMDATAIMQFLKVNCDQQNGTYILRRHAGHSGFILYECDLSNNNAFETGPAKQADFSATLAKQRKFMWMLAMLSYRFALRIRSQLPRIAPHSRLKYRNREIALLCTCNQLLENIAQLGGEDHAIIRASVFEHLADIHLNLVEAHRASEVSKSTDSSSCIGNKASINNDSSSDATTSDDSQPADYYADSDVYEESAELRDAADLLARSTIALENLVQKEVKAAESIVGGKEQSQSSPHSHGVEEEAEGGVGCEEGSDSRVIILESLCDQVAGLLKKLTRVILLAVPMHLRNANISTGITMLLQLVHPCRLWSELRLALRGFSCHDQADADADGNDSGASLAMGSTERWLFDALPLLWNHLGEICHEIMKRTSGVSLHNVDVQHQIDRLIQALTQVGDTLIAHNSSLSSSSSSSSSSNRSYHSFAHAERLRAQFELQKTGELTKKQKKLRQQILVRLLDQHWESVLGNSIAVLGVDKRLTDINLQIFFEKRKLTATEGSNDGIAVLCSSLLQSLYLLHHFVLSSTLFKQPIYCPVWARSPTITSASASASASACGSVSTPADELPPTQAQAVDATSDDNDLHMLLRQVHCFLQSAMWSIRITTAKLPQNWDQSNKALRLRAGGHVINPQVLFVSEVGKRSTRNSLRECVRRVGDCCNVLAAKYSHCVQFLSASADCAASSSAHLKRVLMSSSQKLYELGAILFYVVQDDINASRLACNILSLRRNLCIFEIMGNMDLSNFNYAIFADSFKTLMPHPQIKTNIVPQLEDICGQCIEAKRALEGMGTAAGRSDDRTVRQVLDALRLEEGLIVFTLGILRRNLSYPNAKFRAGAAGANGLVMRTQSMEEAAEVNKLLEQALDLFNSIRSEKYSAAAAYCIGAFNSHIWTEFSEETDRNCVSLSLEKALQHYSHAHKYYSKFDIGPTLVLILEDMCDLYLASYGSNESQLQANYHSQQQSTAGRDNNSTSALPAAQDWLATEESNVVVQLLGGAIQCLLDCRCAFTVAVVERYRDQMKAIAGRLQAKLTRSMLKVLQAHNRRQLPPALSIEGASSAFDDLKVLYSELAKRARDHDDAVASKTDITVDIYESLCRLSNNAYIKSALLSRRL